uniref:LCN-type CS-alpha/beta domain-containing protein n=1 Tax=Strigamia maritima TaxID=126957 RepID=T1IRI5_STRMM
MKHYCLFVVFCIMVIGITDGGVTNHCYWDGTAPWCKGICDSSYKTCKRDKYGDGKKCKIAGTKAYCCSFYCPE